MYMNDHSPVTPVCRTPQSPGQGRRKPAPAQAQATGHVRIALSAEKLQELMRSGALCAGDMHCLDCESKQCVWRICLRACLKHLVARPVPG